MEQMIEDEDELEFQNMVNTLVISYHNIAVEEEYFNNFDESLLHYQNSVNSSEEYLGQTSQVTQHFR